MNHNKKIITWITALMMAATMMPGVTYAQESESGDPDTQANDIIVVYEKDAQCTQAVQGESILPADGQVPETVSEAASVCADSVSEQTGAAVTGSSFISDSAGDDGAALQVTLEEGADVDEAISVLQEDPEIAYVQKNHVYKLMEGTTEAAQGYSINDYYADRMYHLGPWDSTFQSSCGANVLEAWLQTRTSRTVSVAVLDSGVQIDHPDLAANIDLANRYSVLTKDQNVEDNVGHGTHVAGIIGAVANNSRGVAGTSYNARIIPIKVAADTENVYSAQLVSAYTYLMKQIAAGKIKDLHVINVSVGGYEPEEEDKLLQNMIRKMREENDVVTVCAGGNGDIYGRPETDKVYPGDFDEAFCVTALASSGTNVSWSDYNEYKDISAPGMGIWSTIPYNDYDKYDGTSMSAPIVSGIMALLWTENPNLTVNEAVKAAETTAHPVNPAKNDRGAATGSKGAIDAAAALQYVRDNYGSAKINISRFKAKAKLSTKLYVYTGTARKPAVIIPGLTKGEDYSQSFKNNVNVGRATVTVTGKGAYRGSFSMTYSIRPKATKITSFTRYKKAFKLKWKKQSKQVTGYQVQYSRKSSMAGAKTKTVKGASNNSTKIKGLKSKKLYYVRVRTYKNASGKVYYSKWTAKKKIRPR